MRKIMAVIRYEYKMQFNNPVTWGVLLAVTLFTLMDNFPSVRNLARLEFLNNPAYFVYRIMSIDGLVLIFGLMFLMGERLPLDRKTEMKHLLMSYALQKRQYVAGKLFGGFLYAFSILCIFLAFNTTVYFMAAPFKISLTACIVPLAKAIIVSAFPVCLFVSFCSVALPGMMDIRLFYLLAAILFGFNASYVGSANTAPFYLITSGDLIRLIWIHPKWSFVDTGSIFANGLFLIGSGFIFGSLLFIKHSVWRSECYRESKAK